MGLATVPGPIGRQIFAERSRQTVNRGDVAGGDAYRRFVLEIVAQLEVGQRVEAVLGEGTVRIDRAAQDLAEFVRHQTPEPREPFLLRQRVQLGKESTCV